MKRIACIGLLMVFLGATAGYPVATSSVKGLVINTTDTAIEVKKGRKEFLLYWTENTKVLKEGQAADRTAVEICQKVKASYIARDGKRELVTLDILTESYCKK